MMGRNLGIGSGRISLLLLACLAGLLCITGAVLAYTQPWASSAAEEDVEWDLTLVGSHGEEVTVSFEDIKSMVSCNGRGGYFTTAGAVFGPYRVKGVSVDALCEKVGGIGPNDILFVSAIDGYSAVFDRDQIDGNLPAYDPETIREVPDDSLRLILIYEQDGKPLSHEDGKPLRIAVVGDSDLLTEGLYWVKWVNKIEIITP